MQNRILLACLALTSSLALSEERPEWDNPRVFQVNREKPHTTMMVYPSAALARQGDRTRSPWFCSLNGRWRFHWVARPADRPVGF